MPPRTKRPLTAADLRSEMISVYFPTKRSTVDQPRLSGSATGSDDSRVSDPTERSGREKDKL